MKSAPPELTAPPKPRKRGRPSKAEKAARIKEERIARLRAGQTRKVTRKHKGRVILGPDALSVTERLVEGLRERIRKLKAGGGVSYYTSMLLYLPVSTLLRLDVWALQISGKANFRSEMVRQILEEWLDEQDAEYERSHRSDHPTFGPLDGGTSSRRVVETEGD